MKIIDALKDLPLIDKKIRKNCELINKYASYCSYIGSDFKDKAEQEKEVKSLIQSNQDLVNNSLDLRRRLNLTNATIQVKIDDFEMTIAEWIAFRKANGALLLATYESLNIRKGNEQLQSTKIDLADGNPVSIVRCFDEKRKNTEISKIQDVLDQIDATLEKVNATTDLLD